MIVDEHSGASGAERARTSIDLALHSPTLAFGLIAAIAMAFAFVGLADTNYWIDELFTLFLVDHHGGLSELFRRVLTDTHPPAYYVVLYGWTRIFGLSEAATRSLSALCACGALAVFAFGMRRVYSPAAIAFACAAAATGAFWFEQAQNVRNYAFCVLLAAGLLAAAVSLGRAPADGGFPARRWLGLTLLGALLSFSHFYGLLTTGAVIWGLILTVRRRDVQLALAGGGLVILAADAAFMRVLMAHTQQVVGHMWFSGNPLHLLALPRHAFSLSAGQPLRYGLPALAFAGLVAVFARRNPPLPGPVLLPEARWIATFAALVLTTIYALGLVICFLLAPSMSEQNLLIAAPMVWVLFAALYDATIPRLGQRLRIAAMVALLALLVASSLSTLPGRFLQRREAWKASASYVARIPACAGKPIPVMTPSLFGPDTPFFRRLAQRYFYGRYFGGDWRRLTPVSYAALRQAGLDSRLDALIAARASGADACPVLGWGVHDIVASQARAGLQDLSRRRAVSPARVQLVGFTNAKLSKAGWTQEQLAFVWEVAP